MASPFPYLSLHSEPKEYQFKIHDMIEYVTTSKMKSLVISEGLRQERAWPVMMSLIRARKWIPQIPTNTPPSIIVVSPERLSQWQTDIPAVSGQGIVKIEVLTDPSTSTMRLFDCDVVLVPYDYVKAEYIERALYRQTIKDLQQGKPASSLPERPHLALLSEIWTMSGSQSPFLVLDDFDTIKDLRTTDKVLFAAIKHLRNQAVTCLMLQDPPVDDTSLNLFAYMALMRDHPFDTMQKMKWFFTDFDRENPDAIKVPEGKYLKRLQRMALGFVAKCTPQVLEPLGELEPIE